MRVIITCAGSGGHINPAISFIKEVKDIEFVYLGTNSKIENKIIPKLNIKYYLLNNKGLKKGLINKFKFIYYLIINIFKTYKIIKKEKVNKIITFGGYSSSSVFLANLLLKKEIYIHEQNAIIGRNNKLMLKLCKKIFISFKNTKDIPIKYNNKIVFSGNPSFFKRKKKHNEFNILIVTGSLGASKVTNTLLPLLDMYENIKMISGINSEIKHDKIINYCENMEELLSKVDLIITRAGATTINEISSLSIPSILIPSPNVINNHQLINAIEYLKVKRGFLIEEKDLKIEKIIELINEIKNNNFLYEELSKKAASFYNKNAIKIIKQEMNL